MARQFWTDEEVAELRRRYEAKEYLKEIAKAMGRTHGSVKSQVAEYRDVWAGRAIRLKPAIFGEAMGKNDDHRHRRLVIHHGGFCWLKPRLAERFYELERPLPAGREFWRAG